MIEITKVFFIKKRMDEMGDGPTGAKHLANLQELDRDGVLYATYNTERRCYVPLKINTVRTLPNGNALKDYEVAISVYNEGLSDIDYITSDYISINPLKGETTCFKSYPEVHFTVMEDTFSILPARLNKLPPEEK